MARGVNKVILIGNLGRAPEVRYMPSGGAVANVSIATTKQWRDRESGEQRERTEWHRLVFFNRLAEIAGEYLRRGSKVYVEGELRTREWEKDGQKHYTTEVAVNEMQMLDSRGGDMPPMNAPGQSEATSAAKNDFGPPTSTPRPSPGQSQVTSAAKNDFGPPPADDFDDDIPF